MEGADELEFFTPEYSLSGASQSIRAGPGGAPRAPGGHPTPAIYPAEHNTIAVVRQQISLPWADVFSFENFNAVQSACFNLAACTDDNLVVSAPTGCGKTVLFELGILRLLSCQTHPDAKIVFLAPIKALCQEKVADWRQRFSRMGVRVAELSGDMSNSDTKEISSAQIICTTPEKWDSVTRRWAEHIYLLGKVQLLLVDEAHNIGDARGATLEAVVCRMKTVSKSDPVQRHNLPAANLRIIALSATLPNLSCVGEFVQAKPENVLAFDASFRPVPLTVHVMGYAAQSSDFWFEKSLEKKVPEVLARYSSGRPSLIFCTSRKSAEETTQILGRTTSSWHQDPALLAASQQFSGKLKEAVLKGVAFHHANLQPWERALVEGLFRDRKLRALCCTSTLAMGVNLPAHLVVIKSTAQWQGKAVGYAQMPRSTILQMMGRAGRPGLDDSGVAVIMTDESHLVHYQQMSRGSEVVESQLHNEIAEVLNSEICNKVVASIDDAAQWVKGTFLYTRLKKQPMRYGLQLSPGVDAEVAVTAFLNDKLQAALRELTSASVVQLDEDCFSVESLKPGKIMSRNMMSLATMKVLLGVSADANIQDVLWALCATAEVVQEVRHGQKKTLKELNANVRFPLRKSQKLEAVDKTYLLLQGLLGRQPMEDATMSREQFGICDNAGRVLQALADHQADIRGGRGLLSAVLLRRNLDRQLWENDVSELYQLHQQGGDKLPAAVVSKLAAAGFSTLISVAKASSTLIDTHAEKRAPFGTHLVALARRVVGQSLSIQIRNDPLTGDSVSIEVTRKYPMWLASGDDGGFRGAPNGPQNPLETMSYTLIAYTKRQRKLVGLDAQSDIHGLHLYRKIDKPCSVVLPATALTAVRSSTLVVSFVSSVVGLDEYASCAPDGASSAVEVASEASMLVVTNEGQSDDEEEALSRPKTSTKPKPKTKARRAKNKAPIELSPSERGHSDALQNVGSKTETTLKGASTDRSEIKAPHQMGRGGASKPVKSERALSKASETPIAARLVSSFSTSLERFEYKGGKAVGEKKHLSAEFEASGGVGWQDSTPGRTPDKDLAPTTVAPPAASGLSRKGTTGIRDIRDSIATGGSLTSLQRKADEMKLREAVKSSRLVSDPDRGAPSSTSNRFLNSVGFGTPAGHQPHLSVPPEQNTPIGASGLPSTLFSKRSGTPSFFKKTDHAHHALALNLDQIHEGPGSRALPPRAAGSHGYNARWGSRDLLRRQQIPLDEIPLQPEPRSWPPLQPYAAAIQPGPPYSSSSVPIDPRHQQYYPRRQQEESQHRHVPRLHQQQQATSEPSLQHPSLLQGRVHNQDEISNQRPKITLPDPQNLGPPWPRLGSLGVGGQPKHLQHDNYHYGASRPMMPQGETKRGFGGNSNEQPKKKSRVPGEFGQHRDVQKQGQGGPRRLLEEDLCFDSIF